MPETDRKEGQDNLRISLEQNEVQTAYKLKMVLKHLNMSTFDYDIRRDLIYMRKDTMLLEGFTPYWFEEMDNYYYMEHISQRLPEIVRSSFVKFARQQLEIVKNNTGSEIISFDIPIVYSGGNTRWVNVILTTLTDAEGVPAYAIGYCKDIHEEKKELFRLRKIAQTDALTGFRNKNAGMYRIQTKLSEGEDAMYFLAMIDLNRFKNANDLFGHSFGDLILKETAGRMENFFDHETICSRVGGDEFMFFRKCEDKEEAVRLLTALEQALAHTVTYQEASFDVSASVGFSMYPQQGKTFKELYDKADIAMYHAKKHKMNVPVQFEESMDIATNE